jgi:hypothetical protein
MQTVNKAYIVSVYDIKSDNVIDYQVFAPNERTAYETATEAHSMNGYSLYNVDLERLSAKEVDPSVLDDVNAYYYEFNTLSDIEFSNLETRKDEDDFQLAV